jgi:hypothetical protein
MESQKNGKSFQGDDSSVKTDPDIFVAEAIPTNEMHDKEQKALRDEEKFNGQPRWVQIRHRFREPLAEFFGVFTLIIFGDGVVAQVVLSKGEKGDYQSISWGYLSLFFYRLILQLGNRSHAGRIRIRN